MNNKLVYFQFALISEDLSIRKILLVEAKNHFAVSCIETILSVDGRVSDYCRIVATIHDSNHVQIRSSIMDECSYIDFMLDVVDQDRLLKPRVASLFQKSLTQEERSYASNKLRARFNEENKQAIQRYKNRPTDLIVSNNTIITHDPGREEFLTSALVNMGFSKASIRKWISDQGNTLGQGQISDKIKEAIRTLAA